MEFSTPSNPKENNLRRRTLMKLVETPITSELMNDESERTSRRSIVEIQKRNVEAQSPSLNDSVRFSGDQEIKDHLKICTKLYSENKITRGVAWQLQIIDLLKVVSRNKSADSLQVASASLDIGAKVYGLRVDDVHAEGMKLANSMARFATKKPETEEVNEDDPEKKDEAAPRSRRKKKMLGFDGGVKSTLAKDRSTLLAPIPQLESVFFSNRIDSNLSTVDNLFTNSLPMDKSCSKLLALADVKAWPTGPDEAVEGLEDVKCLDIDLLPKDGNICTPFQNFVLDKWDVESEEQNNASIDDALANNVVVFDDDGIPVHELDGPIDTDAFNDGGGLTEDDEEPPITEDFLTRQFQQEVAHTVDIMNTDSTLQRSEYSYNGVVRLANGKVLDRIWAGPSHWKLKFIRRNKERYTGALELPAGAKRKKKTQEPEQLDFFSTEDVLSKLEKLKKIKIKKKIHPANKITLPLPNASNQNMMRGIHELMIKPGTVVTQINNDSISKGAEKTQDNIDQLDNQEDHDVDNVCDMGDNMDCMDLDQGDFVESQDVAKCSENFMGENLVDAPEYAAKTYIPYALQAKKMDMRKLKNFVWQILTPNSEGTQKVILIEFSKVFAELKTTLPIAMRKELSCSLAFSAVLHLCNEKNLKLTQTPGAKDFTVEF